MDLARHGTRAGFSPRWPVDSEIGRALLLNLPEPDYETFRIASEEAGFRPILTGMNPVLMETVADIQSRLVSKGWQPVVAEAFRTEEMQAEKFEQGYSMTKGGSHLTGEAVDLVDARYRWNIEFADQLIAYRADLETILKDYPHLRWGGYFPGYGKYGDWAHIEINPEWEASL